MKKQGQSHTHKCREACAQRDGGSDYGELCHVIMETEHHRILLYRRLEKASGEVQS